MEFKEILGENIRHYRKIKGYTIKDIAEKVGITEATMQKYEKGSIRRVDIEMLKSIAEAIGVPPETLTGWEKPDEEARVKRLMRYAELLASEIDIIEKYRSLDDKYKSIVDSTLDTAYKSSLEEKGEK